MNNVEPTGAPPSEATQAERALDPIAHVARAEVSEPLQGAPSLTTFNGVGTALYGRRDERPDGTYVATRYATIFFIPVFALGAYRVSSGGRKGSFLFHGKVPTSGLARLWSAFIAAVALATVGLIVFDGVYNSQAHRFGRELAPIARAERAAKTETARENVIAQYRALLSAYPRAATPTQRRASLGIVRLSLASLPTPMRAAHVEQTRQLLRQLRSSLSPDLRGGVVGDLLFNTTKRWVEQIGARDVRALRAGLRLLESAQRTLEGGDHGQRLGTVVNARRRALAEALGKTWPLDAVRSGCEMLPDPAALRIVAKQLAVLVTSPRAMPSAWLELAGDIERWIKAARSARYDKRQIDAVVARLITARAVVAKAERKALLAGGDDKALAAALSKTPGDQQLALALAALRERKGDVKGALAVIEALGPHGSLVRAAQTQRASLLARLGKLARAEQLLSQQLGSSLPRFVRARVRYQVLLRERREQLVARSNTGMLPKALLQKVQAAPKGERMQVISTWIEAQLRKDEQLSKLRARYAARASVISTALALGSVRLQRANAARGKRREGLLAGAERAFLAIQGDAEGVPSYHLGLGQVYHRLGKRAEGERELHKLLDQKNPTLTLAVVRVYRELGMVNRARAEAEKLFGTASGATKKATAYMLSLLARDRDEQMRWLRQADLDDRFVRASMQQLEAERAIERGELARADGLLAKAAAVYEASAAHSGAGANNAALVWQRRYICSGDIANMTRAEKMLEKAYALAPENALVVGNLADIVLYHGLLRVLDTVVSMRALRAQEREVRLLLRALLGGPERARVRAALRESPRVTRALELSQREAVLAPQRQRGYLRQLQILTWTRDVERLRALKAQLQRVKIDSSDADTARARYVAGKEKRVARRLDRWLARLAVRTKRLRAAKHVKATRAALVMLRAVGLQSKARHTGDAKLAAAAVAGYRAALAIDHAFDPAWLVSALLRQALLQASETSKPLRAFIAKKGRRLSLTPLVYELLRHEHAGLAALRARPEIALALAELERTAHADATPTLHAWLLARLGRRSALEKKARAVFRHPLARLLADIALLADPNSEDERANVAALQAGAR